MKCIFCGISIAGEWLGGRSGGGRSCNDEADGQRFTFGVAKIGGLWRDRKVAGFLCGLLLAGVLTGCSKSEETKVVRFAKPVVDKSTTQTVSAGSENQTDFIVERYLAPNERMRRRQARITSVLEK